jgi:alanine dehydrogenase
MVIGVPKEIKDQESRVSCTPASVNQFVHEGHTVYVETSIERPGRPYWKKRKTSGQRLT